MNRVYKIVVVRGYREKEKRKSEVIMDFEKGKDWFGEGIKVVERMDEDEVKEFIGGIIRGLMGYGYSESLFIIIKGEIEFNKMFKEKVR